VTHREEEEKEEEEEDVPKKVPEKEEEEKKEEKEEEKEEEEEEEFLLEIPSNDLWRKELLLQPSVLGRHTRRAEGVILENARSPAKFA
jgi:hypothetical protein